MRFPVYPAEERRRSVVFSAAAFGACLIEVVLVLAAMYGGEAAQGLTVFGFVVAVMCAMLSWNACIATLHCHEQVTILPDQGLVTLHGPTGKAVRTLRFTDIRKVRTVHLPIIRYAGRSASVTRQAYICVSSVWPDTDANRYVDVRKNPNCIVFAYDEYVAQVLHHAMKPQASDTTE